MDGHLVLLAAAVGQAAGEAAVLAARLCREKWLDQCTGMTQLKWEVRATAGQADAIAEVFVASLCIWLGVFTVCCMYRA